MRDRVFPRLVMLCVSAAAMPVCAQQANTSATLSGYVRDATPAVLPGVTIKVRNQDLGREWSDVSDQDGRFGFLRLPPGGYVLSASADGFAPLARTFHLTIGQAVDLPVTLGVAGRSESIQVTDNPVLLEAARTQVAGAVRPAEIDSLPLNGRNYLDLALLVPGVSRTNTGVPQQFAETSAVPGTGISISGQRNLNNSFIVDGLSANDDAAGLAGTYFSQEVIREFEVVTAGANSEFGRASSGYLNIATRSGTSEWHGRVYSYLRNQRFDARNALATRRDALTQAQYGATAGGPVVRGRTFVFANFEQTQRNAAGYVTIAPQNVASINAALPALAYPGPAIGTGEFATGWNLSNGFARVDHRITDNHQLVVRYSTFAVSSANARSVGGLNSVSRGTALDDRDSTVAASEVATLSPHTLNEVRFQATRSRLAAPPNDSAGPAVSIAGVANFGTSTTSPVGRDLDSYEGADTLTLARGKHAVKVGTDFLLNRVNIYFPGAQAAAVYNFSSMSTFLAGRYTTFTQAFGDPYQFQSNPNAAVFAQDDWKATGTLTVSAGLRYDLQKLPDAIHTDTSNLAPRIGIAWSPGDRRTVLRANYGLFFDRLPLRATSNALQRDGSKYRVALLAWGQPGAPMFPQQLADFPDGQYINITTIDPAIRDGYSHQAGLQVERTLTSSVNLSLGYEWVRGLHLILSRNVNVPTLSAASAAAAGIANLGRPDPRFGNVSRYESSGDSYYHALLASLRGRIGRVGELSVAYTLSKTIDDTGNFFFSSPQNNDNLRDDRGLSDNDQRHRLTVTGTLSSPLSGGSRWSSVFRNWQLAGLFRYASALPFNVQLNYDRNNDTNLNDRPVGVGRNTGCGFDFVSLDARASREFRASERLRIQVLAEAFNLTNRVNFAVPNNVIGADPSRPLASFGRPTAVLDPRQMQLGARLSF